MIMQYSASSAMFLVIVTWKLLEEKYPDTYGVAPMA